MCMRLRINFSRRIVCCSGSSGWAIAKPRSRTVREAGPSVFAHYSNIAAQGFRELQEGQKVSFDVTQGQKGLQAENIVPA